MTDFPVFDTTVEQTMQAEEPEKVPPIPVTVTDPAQVRELPAKSGNYVSFVPGANAIRILDRDPRRKSAVIIVVDDEDASSVFLGANQASANGPDAGIVPKGFPLRLTHLDEVWARIGEGAPTISVITEYWAD